VSSPSGSDSAAGQDIQNKHFPALAQSPTSVLFQLPSAAWSNPQVLTDAQQRLAASGQFTTITGPLNPNGAALSPAVYQQLHAQLGPANGLPPVPPASLHVPAASTRRTGLPGSTSARTGAPCKVPRRADRR